MTADLDLRTALATDRRRHALDRFDRTPEGQSFVLVTDADPRPVFDWLRTERAPLLLWCPLEHGPTVWRTEVIRLKPKESETEISPYFGRDHDEIDALLGYLRRDLAARDADRIESIRGLFDEFDRRLERHIRWEEEILFPAVEERVPMFAFGPGPVMRSDHVQIRENKAAAHAALAAGSMEKAQEAIEMMVSALVPHNQREESVYYPTSDQVFSLEDRAGILARVRSMP